METVLSCRIILETPPPGVDYALQQGRGPAAETVQTQRSDGSDLRFDLTAGVRTTGNSADFRGPFIQGPAGGRFVYIGIGTFAGQADTPWSRRLKIPLTGITPDMIRRASSGKGALLETRVQGTGPDGTPACASVKGFGGWSVRVAR